MPRLLALAFLLPPRRCPPPPTPAPTTSTRAPPPGRSGPTAPGRAPTSPGVNSTRVAPAARSRSSVPAGARMANNTSVGADASRARRARRSRTSRSRGRSATRTRSRPRRTSTSCSTRSARPTSPARATSHDADAQRAQRAEAVVRLSGGQRRGREEHRDAARAFPALASYAGNANAAASCASAASTAARRARSPPAAGSATSCTAPTSRSTTRRRRSVTVEACGPARRRRAQRLGPGHASPPPTAPGIRQVELIDVTNPLAPAVVGVEDYAEVAHGRQPHLRLQPARAVPGPQPRDASGRPRCRPASARVTVRVTDTGGNVVEQRPLPRVRGHAVRPRRGQRHATRPRRGTLAADLDQGPAAASGARSATAPRPGVRGRLDQRGRPADRRRARDPAHARPAPRRRARPARDAHHRRPTGASSRRSAPPPRGLLQFAWLSHANDVRFGANGYLTLQARADAAASPSPPAARASGARSRSAGSCAGVSRGGVPVVVQGRAARLAPLRHVRRHDDVEQRPLQGPLPLPQLRLARAAVSSSAPASAPPRASRTRRATRRRVTVRSALRSRLPSVHGHGRRER